MTGRYYNYGPMAEFSLIQYVPSFWKTQSTIKNKTELQSMLWQFEVKPFFQPASLSSSLHTKYIIWHTYSPYGADKCQNLSAYGWPGLQAARRRIAYSDKPLLLSQQWRCIDQASSQSIPVITTQFAFQSEQSMTKYRWSFLWLCFIRKNNTWDKTTSRMINAENCLFVS